MTQVDSDSPLSFLCNIKPEPKLKIKKTTTGDEADVVILADTTIGCGTTSSPLQDDREIRKPFVRLGSSLYFKM
jgi:hypothetical protein